jgi:2-oxoglutarate dehydrogenase E1 component
MPNGLVLRHARVQEEPKNMGAWLHVRPRLDVALRDLPGPTRPVRYVGRPSAASAATASMAIHVRESRSLMDAALGYD